MDWIVLDWHSYKRVLMSVIAVAFVNLSSNSAYV